MVVPSLPVTVLMAVRDTPPAQLRQAILSIRGQTFTEFEFLIMDDGSTGPDTLAELEFQRLADGRIRLQRGPPQGLTQSLNHGLQLARGKLIARQDADDWSEPERLEQQAVFLQGHPPLALCGTNAWMHMEDGRKLWRTRLPENPIAIREAMQAGNPFTHGSVMFRTDAAHALGGYRKEFSCAQDYDLFWRMSEAGGAVNLPQCLYHYRFNRSGVSARRAGEQARSHRAAQILAEARRQGVPENVFRALATADLDLKKTAAALRHTLKQVDHCLLAGDVGPAAPGYLDVLMRDPISGLAWGKLLRWIIFSALPPARCWCFR